MTGCVTCPTKDCPPQDTIIIIEPLNLPIKIPKGHLNPEMKNKGWIDDKDFKEMIREKKEMMKRKEMI